MVSVVDKWKRIAPIFWPLEVPVLRDNIIDRLTQLNIRIKDDGRTLLFMEADSEHIIAEWFQVGMTYRETTFQIARQLAYNEMLGRSDFEFLGGTDSHIDDMARLYLVPINALDYYRKRGCGTVGMLASVFDVDDDHIRRVLELEKEHWKCHKLTDLRQDLDVV